MIIMISFIAVIIVIIIIIIFIIIIITIITGLYYQLLSHHYWLCRFQTIIICLSCFILLEMAFSGLFDGLFPEKSLVSILFKFYALESTLELYMNVTRNAL